MLDHLSSRGCHACNRILSVAISTKFVMLDHLSGRGCHACYRILSVAISTKVVIWTIYQAGAVMPAIVYYIIIAYQV
jgi:hypothetical protein